jgi:starch phosphorylase
VQTLSPRRPTDRERITVIKAIRTFRVRPTLPDALHPLATLAQNLRWVWDTPTREVFRWAGGELWDAVGGNPVALLGRLPSERLAALAADAAFGQRLAEVHDDLQRYLAQPRWAQSLPSSPRIAYFSPEFGITGVMQTYSGGLGILAGDHLKAASDLGLDLVGIGLLYRHGYFRQHLDADGWQQERYPDLNPYGLPLRRLERDDEPFTISVDLAGEEVRCQVWKAEVGRVPLLLLDTDVASNAVADRTVTDKLYGGDVEHRLRQEIVLGIGGVRALELARELGELGPVGADGDTAWTPQVFHMNEGHAGFLQLERIRVAVAAGHDVAEAIEQTRSAVLFTTHTPVPAGIDVFPRELMERYFGPFAAAAGVPFERLLAIGQVNSDGDADQYNMAVSGLRLSAMANGVSQLHGRVSRGMFARLWPGLTAEEVPITSVTNGVHAGTWVGPEMRAVYDQHLPASWPHDPTAWSGVVDIADDVLWRARERARVRFVTQLRTWVREQSRRRGESPSTLGWVDTLFDPHALTIGFARRFAEYKRGALLLRQSDRLRGLLTSTDRPVQIVFAGKAHPRDDIGKGIIRELVHHAGGDPELRARLVFVEDYDMDLAAVLYAGVDVWLNNPRRPYEACGTSGEKAVLNGALHCSTMDGWWDEMFDGENGFAIGSADDDADTSHQDAADVRSLYDLLERSVVPEFYDRTDGRLPRRWLGRVRRSLATLGANVLAERMVQEYTTELYLPIAGHAASLTADGGRRADGLAAWRGRIASGWDGVEVTEVQGEEGPASIGQERSVSVGIRLGALTLDDVRVELLHGGVGADGDLLAPAVEVLRGAGEDGVGLQRFAGTFTCATSGEYGFAVRVVPDHPDLLTWADVGRTAWGAG